MKVYRLIFLLIIFASEVNCQELALYNEKLNFLYQGVWNDMGVIHSDLNINYISLESSTCDIKRTKEGKWQLKPKPNRNRVSINILYNNDSLLSKWEFSVKELPQPKICIRSTQIHPSTSLPVISFVHTHVQPGMLLSSTIDCDYDIKPRVTSYSLKLNKVSGKA